MSDALLTDLYQLTMAYGYWKKRMDAREAAFHVTFRSNPFRSGFTVAAGLAPAIEYLQNLRFSDDDIRYLRDLALFDEGFLEYLKKLTFRCDVDAVEEGTVVFPHEPLVRVVGPLLQCQLIETALLNFINFQSLIATKAARIVIAAKEKPVIEFGLRRAQGRDGALSATRAAYIGGVAGTSNVLAAKQLGIPARGTHAHSWVMAFDSESEAFDAYGSAMPRNALFLVDTYNTEEGVRHAIEAGRKLREQGHDLLGIRLDSGDLAHLSKVARQMLDAAGFSSAKITATNDLDEHIITSLIEQGAPIDVWGVGTRLITAYDQPALGAVYKLGAIQNANGAWEPRIKLSEQTAKVSVPGILGVRRFAVDGENRGDMIYAIDDDPVADPMIVDPMDPTRRKRFDTSHESRDLLVPVFRRGKLVYDIPPLDASRRRTHDELSMLHAGIKRLVYPHLYPVGLHRDLHERRTALVLAARGVAA